MHECITNPLFMEKDCKEECKSMKYLDVGRSFCRHEVRRCNDRSENFQHFVFKQCNRTCRRHYYIIEKMHSPSNFMILVYHMLPVVYTVAFLVLCCYQLLVYSSNPLMLRLEQLKARLPAFSTRAQAGLVLLCENQDSMGSFGPQAVGRLFVCGYYVVEGGMLIGLMGIAVYLGPRLRLHRTHPRLVRNSIVLLMFYTILEATFTILRDFSIHERAAEISEELHQPVYVEGELTCKKLAMVGVAILFIQSSTRMMRRKPLQLLPAESEEEPEASPAQEAISLGGRLLLAALFCFVGVVEGKRVLGGDLHDPPDGHDHLWPKVIQLLFLVPFTLGFKTKLVTQLLAISLVLEAMTAWMFWDELYTDLPSLFHAIHSKDHFATNVAVAGGLLLIQEAPGKYTLDAYMKKKD